MKTWEEMTARERDVEIDHLLFNWTRHEQHGVFWYRAYDADTAPGLPDVLPDGHEVIIVRSYTTDHAACCLVEDEIERRGLIPAYTGHIRDIVAKSAPLGKDQHFGYVIWRLLRATPDQRCHAAWLAVGEGRSDG